MIRIRIRIPFGALERMGGAAAPTHIVQTHGEQAMNRIGHRFFHPKGDLYFDMARHIAREGTSQTLQFWLEAYESVPLDEAPAESSHKDALCA